MRQKEKSVIQRKRRKFQILCLTAGLLCSGVTLSRKPVYARSEITTFTEGIVREGETSPTPEIPQTSVSPSPTDTTPSSSPSASPSPAGTTPSSSPSVSPSATLAPTPTPVPPSIHVTMNYQTGKLTYSAGAGGSTKFYLSTNKMKTWELLELDKKEVDVNGLLKSSDVKIYLKGNKDQNPVEVILKGEVKGLKAKYSVAGGKGKIDLTGATGIVEYRIGKDGNWAQYTEATFQTAPYEITGVTLQFRVRATMTERSGKIVNLKIPKRPSAPNVKVDGDKFVLTGMKSNAMQYRLNNTNEWKTYVAADGKSRYLDLRSILAPGTTDNTKIPAATIEVRTMATEKKVASAVRIIEIPEQKTMPTTTTVQLNGTTLTCTDASAANQYEYTMLHTGEVLDMQKAKWKTVRSSKPVLIKKTGNSETIPGDIMIIRLKLVKDPITKEEGLPSQYLSLTISSITPK